MIREKYRFEETSGLISFQPHYYLLKRDVRWYAIILAAALLCLLFAKNKFGQNGFIMIVCIAVLMLFFIVKDYFFKINVYYVFDRSVQAIYRSNPPFVKHKKIMNFEDMTLFTNSEGGSWHYSMGVRKKHFLKSYTISENFSSGKRSIRLQEEYENEILSKIETIVNAKRYAYSNL